MIESKPPVAGQPEWLDRAAPDASSDVKPDKGKKKKKDKGAENEPQRDRATERIFDGRMDADKIMIKWIRAAVALTTTGVAIERVLWHVSYSGHARVDPFSILRFVGLGIALIGVFSLIIACQQHFAILRRLDRGEPPPLFKIPLSLFVGVSMAVLVTLGVVGVIIFLEA